MTATTEIARAGIGWGGRPLRAMLEESERLFNDGAYFAIQNNLPYGSWANPDNKFCSVSIAWVYLIRGYSGIFRALSMAYVGRGYLEEVIAGHPGTWNMIQGGGPNHYGQPGA